MSFRVKQCCCALPLRGTLAHWELNCLPLSRKAIRNQNSNTIMSMNVILSCRDSGCFEVQRSVVTVLFLLCSCAYFTGQCNRFYIWQYMHGAQLRNMKTSILSWHPACWNKLESNSSPNPVGGFNVNCEGRCTFSVSVLKMLSPFKFNPPFAAGSVRGVSRLPSVAVHTVQEKWITHNSSPSSDSIQRNVRHYVFPRRSIWLDYEISHSHFRSLAFFMSQLNHLRMEKMICQNWNVEYKSLEVLWWLNPYISE